MTRFVNDQYIENKYMNKKDNSYTYSHRYKNNISATLSPRIYKQLTKYCKKNCINKSALVEKAIINYLESFKTPQKTLAQINDSFEVVH